MVSRGAGELLLNNIDRDGSRDGYDLALCKRVAQDLPIPVIVLGGAGIPGHIYLALNCNAISAAAAANFWHYTEHSVAVAKAFVIAQDCDLRYDSLANYRWAGFGDGGRIEKRSESELEEMIFEYIPDEII